MRLAWFAPLPPVRGSAVAHAAALLPRLSLSHLIDVFVEDEVWAHWHAMNGASPWRALKWTGDRTPDAAHGACRLFRAWDFVYAHAAQPYDLMVYELGQGPAHDYLWPYLLRHPGLVVLHDMTVHAARLRRLLYLARQADYRAEFTFCHPGIDLAVTDYMIEGLQGAPLTVWPMLRLVMETARGVAAPSPRLATELGERYPRTPLTVISPGVPASVGARHAPAELQASSSGPTGLSFLLFASGDPDAHLREVLPAFAAVRERWPTASLSLLDERADGDEAVRDAIAAADVCLCLDWPTTRAVSRHWLQALASGKPTIVLDGVHLVDVPLAEPLYWTLLHADTDAQALRPRDWREAVAVAIDVTAEEPQLCLAMTRLADDETLRAVLGMNARRFWEQHFTLDLMTSEAMDAIEWCHGLPPLEPPADLPAHLRANGSEQTRATLAELDVETDPFSA